jgi:hypothetical protein
MKSQPVKIKEKLGKKSTQKIPTTILTQSNCACCNNPIKKKAICIYYYGSLIELCGEPCGIRDYLETQ